jgi:hypothetical protein
MAHSKSDGPAELVRAGPELAKMLRETGLGSHPDVVLALAANAHGLRMKPRAQDVRRSRLMRVALDAEWLEAATPELPEHRLWRAVIEGAVIDVQRGGIHARRARRLNHLSGRLNRRASRRITVLTAPEGMPLSQIVERIKRAAHAVF